MRGLEQIPWLYDGMMALVEPFGMGRWRHRLIAEARGRVLEVGCGTGRNLPRYPAAADVVAFDLRLDLLLRARRRAPDIPLVVATVEALPFRSEYFDAVVSSLVFCSVPRPDVGLREIARVLAPGGTLAMMEHVRHLKPFGAWLQDRLQPSWTWLSGGCHINRDTERSVLEAGFQIDPTRRRARGTLRLLWARVSADRQRAPIARPHP